MAFSNPDPHGVRYRRQSSVNNLVVDLTASGHKLFTFSSKVSFVGGRPDGFMVAEGDVLPVLKAHYGVISYIFFAVPIHKY
jgi:hypothetical protein